MSRIAVIGSGISGLAAAYYLSRKHEVSVFERDSRIGGHTNTVMVDSSVGKLAVDTGFIVHNERTYPNFCRLIRELGVCTRDSDMSFAVTTEGGAFEYSSFGLPGFFAQRSNLLRPGHYRLLAEILRFNRLGSRHLDDPALEDVTLRDFLESHRFHSEFVERYLYPMASAVWSTSFDEIHGFPALTLLRFFDNHGLLRVGGHPTWKVIRGGSNQYLQPISAPFRERIYLNSRIRSVSRTASGVTIDLDGRAPEAFDEVVFACHGNQVLPLLADATEAERSVFSSFATTRNIACLHTDESLLPRRKGARASWNYLLGDQGRASVTYHMNRLQSLPSREHFCVTLNADERVDPAKVIERIVYHHPRYDRPALASQRRWAEVSGAGRRTHYCGAYWFYGFHEDGVRSALRVAKSLGVPEP